MWWKSGGKINIIMTSMMELTLKEERTVDAGTLRSVWLGDGGAVGSGVDGGRH